MNNREDYFVKQIIKKTGLSEEFIMEKIKDDSCYPPEKNYEEGLCKTVDKFAWLARIMDKMIEKTPMSLKQITQATAEMVEQLEITDEDREVISAFNDCISEMYGDIMDPETVAPSSVEDMGRGVIMIKFNRIIPDYIKKSSSPQEKADDYIANEPFSLLFIDTTPGVVGFRSFFSRFG